MEKVQREEKNGYVLYHNPGGKTIGTATGRVIHRDGLVFRDLCGTGELLPFEDWRLPPQERAADLAARLPIEQIAGLMMYSPHQMVPALPGGPFEATYHGKSFPESGEEPWAMSDAQRKFLAEDHVRHVLVMKVQSTGTAARWSNAMQAYA